MIFLTFLHNWCFKNSMYLSTDSTGLSIMTVNISWNFKERMVHKLPFFLEFSVVLANSCRGSLQKKDSLAFIFGCKGFLKCNYIFGTGASSIREATPLATSTHFLPPGNPYCVSTVVEFLITYINKLYDYNTDSLCVFFTSPCWGVSKSGDNRLFRYA